MSEPGSYERLIEIARRYAKTMPEQHVRDILSELADKLEAEREKVAEFLALLREVYDMGYEDNPKVWGKVTEAVEREEPDHE